MSDNIYPIIEVDPDWVLEQEALGSKPKFWYKGPLDREEWLFKFPQPHTGQHWAEKIASQLAALLDIPHGRVELACYRGVQGSTTESFALAGWELFHGNQILAGLVLGYDKRKRFRQTAHTLANILRAFDATFTEKAAPGTKRLFCEYLVLDALIGNTDRHHENWGVLRKRTESGWKRVLAPSFDHASSLGRELRDTDGGKSREPLLVQEKVGFYSEKARGAIFGSEHDRHGLSPLNLVRRGYEQYTELFAPALARLDRLDREAIAAIIAQVPEKWMSISARKFAEELLCYNLCELRRLDR